jgi:hypothetical protein
MSDQQSGRGPEQQGVDDEQEQTQRDHRHRQGQDDHQRTQQGVEDAHHGGGDQR